jgi:putative NIF3 family GTP cyclohydrolase 1 type 2
VKKIGIKGSFTKAENIEKINKILKGECLAFGKKTVKTAAIVSGGAHDMFEEAIAEGTDLYITGSRDEYITETCREAQMNFIAMGHYNSERFGIQALMEYVKKKFKVQVKFADVPNPF